MEYPDQFFVRCFFYADVAIVKLVKLADKICNLRDVANGPPVGWLLQRRQKYFDWAKAVVDGLRGVHQTLEHIFDATYKLRP